MDVLIPAAKTAARETVKAVAPVRKLAMGAKALVFLTAVSGTYVFKYITGWATLLDPTSIFWLL